MDYGKAAGEVYLDFVKAPIRKTVWKTRWVRSYLKNMQGASGRWVAARGKDQESFVNELASVINVLTLFSPTTSRWC